jgi:hypothetical protein
MGDEIVNVFPTCMGLNAYLVKPNTLNLVLIYKANDVFVSTFVAFNKRHTTFAKLWLEKNALILS